MPVWEPTGNCTEPISPKGNNYGCVIMASGLGKRFGGNKLMADFHGSPMICRILDVTEGLFARRVVVTRHADVAQYARSRGTDVILHSLPRRSDTVRLGLKALGNVDGAMFCPGYQPLLRHQTVEALLQSAALCPDAIWRTCFGGQPGAPILFPHWAFDKLLSLPEGKGGGYVAKEYPDRVRYLPVQDGAELMDADTQETLEYLKSLRP